MNKPVLTEYNFNAQCDNDAPLGEALKKQDYMKYIFPSQQY